MSTAISAPEFNERERARDLVKEIAGHCWHGRGDMIDRVYEAIRNVYPRAKWTRRRIRSFWHREAAGVRWSEMRELEVVADIECRRRQQIEHAQAEHHEFITSVGATLDRLAISDQEFHREQMEALRALAISSIDPTKREASGQGNQNSNPRGGGIAPDHAGGRV